jgi:hypothetical protein
MTESKKILTVALMAVAFAASLMAIGNAFAIGGGGKGEHGHGYWRGNAVLDSGCHRWIPGFGRVYICN